MLLLTKVKQFSNLLKIKNRCYSFSCNFLERYVNGCPESKILSLKYPHLRHLLQTSQFYMGKWHKLLKSKHCYFFNITLPWMKIWRWQCSRYLCNNGFLLCEKCRCLKFRYTEVIHNFFFFCWVFLQCTIESDIYEHVHFLLGESHYRNLTTETTTFGWLGKAWYSRKMTAVTAFGHKIWHPNSTFCSW